MLEFFKKQKQRIESYIKGFIKGKEKDFKQVNEWGMDAAERLIEFTSGGKMLRGGLTLLTHNLYGGKHRKDALKTAAAMELFQSGFLIHDDIMDRDALRRGKPSLFYQYKTVGEKAKFNDPCHFGESLGLCAGDIAFFLAFEILSELECGPSLVKDIINLYSREISLVGIAQMQDIYFGNMKETPDEKEILNLYLYKTGRYTFSLPMSAGALLAGRDRNHLKKLGKIGECLGLIFQIKDDELGLLGDEKEIGKPVGSDIKENKKSLYRYYLFQKADTGTRNKLLKLFGSKRVTVRDLDYIRNLIGKYQIRELINAKTGKLYKEAESLINSLKDADENYLKTLRELLQYSVERKK